MNRHLAAILAADVVGYSTLMGDDQDGTLEALRLLRAEVFGPKVTEKKGKIVKSMGDGWLVEFASAVDAVTCAIEIQNQIKEHHFIRLRMGIHLGDVVHEEEDFFGDGINVAARLEALTEPGSVLISDAVFGNLDGKLRPSFVDQGELSLKNIERPVRVWNWAPAGSSVETEKNAVPTLRSIAILAFENMSPDPEQAFFGDGLAEEIITTLSRIPSLSVIARNSSFTYRGQAVDVRTVGRELGVAYVVEGSVRASRQRLRVTAQLINAASGTHVWADRYDRRIDDIFGIQDEITREIDTALRVKLSDGEQAQLWLRGTDNVEAWGLAMQGLDQMMQGGPEPIQAAIGLLERAIATDPGYAAAHAMHAQAHWLGLHFGYVEIPKSIRALREGAEKSLALDPNLAIGHLVMAGAILEEGDPTAARPYSLRAIELAPNNATIRAGTARVLLDAGYPAEGEEHIRYAIRLNPFHPVFHHGILANALERQGKEAEAIKLLTPVLERNPDYFAGQLRLASLLALSGEVDRARYHAEEARRINPHLTRAGLEHFYRSPDPADFARFSSGLKQAGLVL